MAHKFLFTGEEPYLLHQELRTRTKAFLEKYGEQGLFVFRADDIDKATITNAIFSGGMFSTKKLIIVYGIPKDSTPSNKVLVSKGGPVETYLIEHREKIPEDSIVILVSYKPDKRTKSYKFFAKHAEVKTYAPLKSAQLSGFVQHELGDLISNGQSQLIVSLVGNTLFNIANECEKLRLYASYHEKGELTDEDITTIVYSQSEIDSFHILDNLFTNKEKAIQLITKAQQQNQDMFQFLGMLYRGLRLVIQMIDLHQQGVTSSKEIASILKVHPFAVAKQHNHIESLTVNYAAIKDIYQQLIQLDRSIKTGTYPSEGFWIEIKKMVRAL